MVTASLGVTSSFSVEMQSSSESSHSDLSWNLHGPLMVSSPSCEFVSSQQRYSLTSSLRISLCSLLISCVLLLSSFFVLISYHSLCLCASSVLFQCNALTLSSLQNCPHEILFQNQKTFQLISILKHSLPSVNHTFMHSIVPLGGAFPSSSVILKMPKFSCLCVSNENPSHLMVSSCPSPSSTGRRSSTACSSTALNRCSGTVC